MFNFNCIMKNHIIVFTLFIVIISNGYGQKDVDSNQANTNSYLTFSPLSTLDFHAPRMRFGYVPHLADHWKLGLDLGLGSGLGLLSNQRESKNDFLWEVRPELYFILKPEARVIKYLSAEFFYIGQSSTLLNDSYEREDGMNLQYDQADYERQKYGMHLKFGLFLNAGRHWGFNFYGGIGFRLKTTSFRNVINARENTTPDRGHGYETIYDAESSDFRPNPALGVKIYFGYKLFYKGAIGWFSSYCIAQIKLPSVSKNFAT